MIQGLSRSRAFFEHWWYLRKLIQKLESFMKFAATASIVFLASLNSFALGAPVSTGADTIAHAKIAFPESTIHGTVAGGDKCSVNVQHGQDGKSITVSIVTSTNAGLYIALCNLRSDDPAIREDGSGNDFPATENFFGSSDYGDGQGTPAGCRFGRTKNSVVVVNFDTDQTGYCGF